jgi:hypothetical protein
MSYIPSFRISGFPQDSLHLGTPHEPQRNTSVSSHKLVPSDPKIWGPITWYNIHTMAFVINKESEISVFIKLLRSICDKIPCHTCREHAKTFLASNPPETYIGNVPSKCFRYTVDFHNHANLLTGKSLMSFDDAFKLYSDSNLEFDHPLTTISSRPYSPIMTIDDLGLSSVKHKGAEGTKGTKGAKKIQEVRKLDSSFFD